MSQDEKQGQIQADLLRYLVECPARFNFHCNKAARRDLRRALFAAASLNGKYLDYFFPDAPPTSVLGNEGVADASGSDDDRSEKMDEDPDPAHDIDYVMTASKQSNPFIDPSHPQRPCVRKFRKGEPLYRCL